MRLRRITALLVAASLAGCVSTHPTPESRSERTVFSGIWEGSFSGTTTDSHGSPVSFPVDLRLVFEGDTVRVFARSDSGEWQEQGVPGSFTMDVLGTNAVIYMLHAGRIPTPHGSRWFETYLIASTAVNDTHMLVRWIRAVSNVDTSEDDPDHAGFSSGEGVLNRVESDGG